MARKKKMLVECCRKNILPLIQYLIEREQVGYTDIFDSNGNTVLMTAILKRQGKKMIQYLYDRAAKSVECDFLQHENADGETVLSLAIRSQEKYVMQIIFDREIKSDVRDHYFVSIWIMD